MCFCIVTWRLGARPPTAILAGLAVSLSPALVCLSVEGMSEVSYVLVVGAGMACVLTGGRWIYLGALCIGAAALIRTNAVLTVPVLAMLALQSRTARNYCLNRQHCIACVFACVLAQVPTMAWALRNYAVTGRFPLVSALEGETLYGANNESVANDLNVWGYWIAPSYIPGETRKALLVQRFGTEPELSDYYHGKAMAWIRGHLPAMPRLVLGKLIRAFAPIPWVPLPASYVVFASRSLLYVFAALLAPFWWHTINRLYVWFLSAMTSVLLVTTVVYYGTYRFSHCFVEVLLVPCIAVGFQHWRETCRPVGRNQHSYVPEGELAVRA
jgi:hypothetical protein